MRTKVGVWIDQRKAIIVAVTEKRGKMSLIIQRPSMGKITIYYDAVMACIRYEESIQLFGSDEANAEFKKHLETKNLGPHIVGNETVDNMTEHQIEAKVLQLFLKKYWTFAV
jgi:hypothetical protein